MSKNGQPDLDLISMVQKARLMHDAEATPSEVSAVYWIEVKCETCTAPTAQTGQWTLNVHKQDVDTVWEKVKTATIQGKLGYKSKVSTASRSGEHVDSRTIVVMTPDHSDEEIQRIHHNLIALQIEGNWVFE